LARVVSTYRPLQGRRVAADTAIWRRKVRDNGRRYGREYRIDAANPIPAEAQCKVNQVDRRGSLVTWAMTCNSPRGEIHSAGSARYAGSTMEGTVTAQVPGPNGQTVDTPGHIAGRYLAPCDAK